MMRSLSACLLLCAIASTVAAQKDDEKQEKEASLPEGRLRLSLDPGRHTAQVRRVFFKDDGKQLVTAAIDGTVRIWDLASGQTLKVIYPPGTPAAESAVMSADGKLLAIASRSIDKGKAANATYVLSLPDGKLVRTLRTIDTQAQNILTQVSAFSPDGKRLAVGSSSASDGKNLRIWDLEREDAKPKVIVLTRFRIQTSLAFAPDGKRLAWISGGNKGGVLNLESEKEEAEIEGHEVAWSPNGEFIATRQWAEPVRIYNPAGKLLHTIRPGGASWHIVFSPDSKTLLVHRDRNPYHRAMLFDVATGKDVLTVDPKGYWMDPRGGAFSPDGQLAATVGGRYSGDVFVWQTADGKMVHQFLCPPWMAGGGAFEQPAWNKEGNAVCWISWQRGGKRMETYDLKELGFVEALTKEQRHDVATKRGGRLSPDGRFLMRIDVNKQTITVWNSQQEQPLLTLYRNGKDWIIWTPEGYYAATPGGEKMLVWKMDHGIDKMPSVYTADRFSKKLHRPDVIKKAFELGSVEAALKELDGAKAKSAEVEALLPPKVDLGIVDQKTAPTIKVKATAVAAVKGQPVTTLRLMLDGRPLSDPKMTLRFDPGQDKVEAEFTVTIPEGKHTLTAFARSPDASNASEPLTVHHVIKANLPSMHVLAIGINEHKDVSLKLNCAKNDAQAIAKTFKAASKGNLFREVHTEEILDQQATRAYILTKVEELRQRTAKSPNDLAVIFFAGHGIKKKDAFYLLTHEADLDKLEGSSLSGDDLRKALGEFPCQVLLMLDACNSAGFGQGKKLSKLGLRPATDDVSRSLTDNDIGVAVFCAAMGHEKAKEEQGNGLFTRAVMDALTKLDEVPFNKVNRLQYLHHVHSHVFDLVSAWSEEKQHPFLNLPWTTESRALRELPKK